MTRLDCVRRLKESQLVIKLMVRCRGALRPEVVSAEKKTCPEKSKVPPELPSAPPPVPPRKLRQARGLADGEANPSPVKKSWNGSRSQSSSQTSSPSNNVDSKSTSFESCESSPKILNGSIQESPKGSPKERSPELVKSKQVTVAFNYSYDDESFQTNKLTLTYVRRNHQKRWCTWTPGPSADRPTEARRTTPEVQCPR